MKYTSIDRQRYSLSNLVQLHALAKRGHIVTWIVGRIGESRVILPPLSENCRLVTILLRKQVAPLSLFVFELKALFRIFQLTEPLDCVILDVYTLPVFLPFFLFRRLLSGLPVLFLRIESNPVETGGRLRSLSLSVLDRFSVMVGKIFCDKILFISPMMSRMYAERLDIPESKLAVWSSSVDTQVFDPSFTTRVDLLRKELGLSDCLGVLYHGMLSKGRGVLEAIRAFEILKAESVNARLILLGDGPLRDEVQRYVRANRLEKLVCLHRPVDFLEVPKYIAACDVGILPVPDHPWWRYQCPIKVLELLAMNKPIIVVDMPATRSVIGNAPVAVYLKATTPQGIADGVRTFLTTRDSLDPTLGRAIAAKFSVDRIATMLEHEISSAINSRGSTRGTP